LVAENVKLTIPLPSPLGFWVETPTGVATTTKLEGFTIDSPPVPPPPSPLHEKNINADKKRLNINTFLLKLLNCFFIFESIENKK
jgi:hypothetical protein